MKGLGSLLFIFGLASTIFSFIEREVRLLAWINNWGPGVAWAIRIGFMVVGGALWIAGSRARAREQA